MALQLLFNGGLTLFFIYCYYYISITAPVKTRAYEMDGADWPKMLLILVIIALVVNILNIIRKTPPAERNMNAIASINYAGVFKSKLFLGMALMLLYAFALPYAGFIPASIVMAALYMMLLGERRVLFALRNSIISVAALYVLFFFLLDIMLPRGVGVFRDFALIVESVRFMF
jgi:hypothetical protein